MKSLFRCSLKHQIGRQVILLGNVGNLGKYTIHGEYLGRVQAFSLIEDTMAHWMFPQFSTMIVRREKGHRGFHGLICCGLRVQVLFLAVTLSPCRDVICHLSRCLFGFVRICAHVCACLYVSA